MCIRDRGRSTPERIIDVGLGLDSSHFGFEVVGRGYRRKRCARHVDDGGDTACGSSHRTGAEVFTFREAGIVEVDMSIDPARRDKESMQVGDGDSSRSRLTECGRELLDDAVCDQNVDCQERAVRLCYLSVLE